MDIKEISLLIDAVSKAEIKNFRLQQGDFSLAMDKLDQHQAVDGGKQEVKIETQKEIGKEIEKEIAKEKILETTSVEETILTKELRDTSNCIQVKSPIVGTFYSASGPDQDTFVKVGDVVKKGQVLCIVEAMKLMNDIECDTNGEIVEVLVHDGDMVEYNQPLFTVRPK